jgi:hypothetical protein
LAVPSIFCRHLREQQAGEAASADDQTIAANLDLCDIPDGLDRSHDGDFELQLRHLVRANWKEARVAKSRGDGAGGDGLEQRLDGADRADTAAQIAALRAQSNELDARASEGLIKLLFAQRKRYALEDRFNRRSRELQESLALFCVEHGR